MIYDEDGRTLLQRMSQQEDSPEEVHLSDAQVSMMIELLVVRLITDSPLLASARLSCDVERIDGGWDLKIRRPK